MKTLSKFPGFHLDGIKGDIKLVSIIFGACAMAGIFLVLLYVAVLCAINLDGNSWEDRARFGNSFGALNAVLSFLAFSGMIIALFLQYQQIKESQRVSAAVNMPLPLLDVPKIHFDVDNSGTTATASFCCLINLNNASETPAIDLVCNARCNLGAACISIVRTLLACLTKSTPLKFETCLKTDWSSTVNFLQQLSATGRISLDVHCAYRSFLGSCSAVSSKLLIGIKNNAANLRRLQSLINPSLGLPAYTGIGKLSQQNVNCLKGLELTVENAGIFSPVRFMEKGKHEHLARSVYRKYSAF